MRDLLLWHVGFSLVVAHRLCSCGAQGPERVGSVVCGSRALVEARGLSSCGTRAYLPRGVWDLSPQPGIEPASPALEGGFFTTGPPGKFLSL